MAASNEGRLPRIAGSECFAYILQFVWRSDSREDELFKLVAALAIGALLSGCAVGVEHIDIVYSPKTAGRPVEGAADTPLQLAVTTQSSPPTERVGRKKNGYGMELGAFAATRPVADIVRDAFTTDLLQRGFVVGASGAQAKVDVTKFVNEFRPHLLLADAEAEVTLGVTVRSPSSAILYARTVTGRGLREDLLAMTAGEARQSLEIALPDAVGTIVNDPDFIKALLLSRSAPVPSSS